MTETCEHCGVDYTDPNGWASDDYMRQGHLLYDCEDVPQDVRDRLNGPPPLRGDSEQ